MRRGAGIAAGLLTIRRKSSLFLGPAGPTARLTSRRGFEPRSQQRVRIAALDQHVHEGAGGNRGLPFPARDVHDAAAARAAGAALAFAIHALHEDLHHAALERAVRLALD